MLLKRAQGEGTEEQARPKRGKKVKHVERSGLEESTPDNLDTLVLYCLWINEPMPQPYRHIKAQNSDRKEKEMEKPLWPPRLTGMSDRSMTPLSPWSCRAAQTFSAGFVLSSLCLCTFYMWSNLSQHPTALLASITSYSYSWGGWWPLSQGGGLMNESVCVLQMQEAEL